MAAEDVVGRFGTLFCSMFFMKSSDESEKEKVSDRGVWFSWNNTGLVCYPPNLLIASHFTPKDI